MASQEALTQATQESIYSKVENQWMVLQNLESKFEKDQKVRKESIAKLKQIVDSETNTIKTESCQLSNLRFTKECLEQSNSKISPILEMIQTEFRYLQEQVHDIGKQINFKYLIKNVSAQVDLARKKRFQKYDDLIKTIRDDTRSRYDLEKSKVKLIGKQIHDFQFKSAQLYSNMNEMSKMCDNFQAKFNNSLEKIAELTLLNNQLDQSIKPLKKMEETLTQEMKTLVENLTILMINNEDQFREYDADLNQIDQDLSSNEKQLAEAIKERDLLNHTINQINVDLVQISEQLLQLSEEDGKRSLHRQTLRTLNEKVLKELNQEISSIERLNSETVNWRECIEAGQNSFDIFKLARKESSELNGKQELELMKEMLDEKKKINEQRRSELDANYKIIKKEKEKLLKVQNDLEAFPKQSNETLDQINREKSQIKQDLTEQKAKKAELIEEVTKLRKEYQELMADNQIKKEEISKKEMLLEAFAWIEGLRQTDNSQPSPESANQTHDDDKLNQSENLDSLLTAQINEENSSLEITANVINPDQKKPSSEINVNDTSIAINAMFDPTPYFENSAMTKSPSKRKISKFFISRSSDESHDDPESKLRRINLNYDSILNTKKVLSRKSAAKIKVVENRK